MNKEFIERERVEKERNLFKALQRLGLCNIAYYDIFNLKKALREVATTYIGGDNK